MARTEPAEASDPIDLIAHETAVLTRRAESARKRVQALDRSSYLLLDAIQKQQGLPLRVLADHFQLEVSTVSRQVAVLEAKGWVKRQADPSDGRVCLLAITEAGAVHLRTAQKARRALFNELLADWTDEGRHALAAALLRLNQAFIQHDRQQRGETVDSGTLIV